MPLPLTSMEMSAQLEYALDQMRFVSSKDKAWEIAYFVSQSCGLAELVCAKDSIPTNSRQVQLRNDEIVLARAMRAELLKRYGLVTLCGDLVFRQDGTPVSFSDFSSVSEDSN